MNISNISEIQKAQFFGGVEAMFSRFILPELTSEQEIMRFAGLLRKWRVGERFDVGDYCRHGYDVMGYPMVYKSKTTHSAQDNIQPGGEYSGSVYELIGYINGHRLWSEPFRELDSYALDQVVPHYAYATQPAKLYAIGIPAYQGEYVIDDVDNSIYMVIPKQITMNKEYVEFTNTDVYQAVPSAIYVDNTSIKIPTLGWFKSKKDDNRFEPMDGSPVWEVTSEPTV